MPVEVLVWDKRRYRMGGFLSYVPPVGLTVKDLRKGQSGSES